MENLLKTIKNISIAVVSVFVALFTINQYLQYEVSKICYQDEFINKLVNKLAPVYIIFDENKDILLDNLTEKYIRNIDVERITNENYKVIVRLKKDLNYNPILTCISGNYNFTTTITKEKNKLIYNLRASMTSAGVRVFKLEVIKNTET